MKITKPVITIIMITLCSLAYVHQQVELVKLSYEIENREKKLKDMLDYKESIGYTIKNLESPSRLEKILVSKNIEVAFPKVSQVVMAGKMPLARAKTNRLKSAGVERRFDLFGILDFLNPRAEAQANEK